MSSTERELLFLPTLVSIYFHIPFNNNSLFTPLLTAVVSPAQASGGVITELENTEAAQRGATAGVGGGASSGGPGHLGKTPSHGGKDNRYGLYVISTDLSSP